MPLKKVYNYYPAVDSLATLSKEYIVGYETCLWTEYIWTNEKAEYQAFPRNVAAAEVGWTARANKDWDSFRRRMPKVLDAQGAWKAKDERRELLRRLLRCPV